MSASKKPVKAAQRKKAEPTEVVEAGLITIEKFPAGRGRTPQAMMKVLAQQPKPLVRLTLWVEEIEADCRKALRRKELTPGTHVLAHRCLDAAAEVRGCLDVPSGDEQQRARSMEAAATLADEYHSLTANGALYVPVSKKLKADRDRRKAQKGGGEGQIQKANDTVIYEFSRWEQSVARTLNYALGQPLEDAVRVRRYINEKKPSRRKVDRLNMLLTSKTLPSRAERSQLAGLAGRK